MNEYVNRERQLATNPNAEVARSQLAVKAMQVSFAAEQIHDQAQSLQWTIPYNIQPVVSQLNGLEQTCREFVRPDDWPQARIEVYKNACHNLSNGVGDFREKIQNGC